MVTNGDNSPAGLFRFVPVACSAVVPRSGTTRHQSTYNGMQAHDRQHVRHTHNLKVAGSNPAHANSAPPTSLVGFTSPDFPVIFLGGAKMVTNVGMALPFVSRCWIIQVTRTADDLDASRSGLITSISHLILDVRYERVRTAPRSVGRRSTGSSIRRECVCCRFRGRAKCSKLQNTTKSHTV